MRVHRFLILVGAIGPIAFSPDGETLAARSLEGTLRLWDVATDVLQCTVDINEELLCPSLLPGWEDTGYGWWQPQLL